MAVMSEDDRRESWASFIEECNRLGIRVGTNKTNLRACADALDQFLSDNAATINSALPQPGRGEMTAAAKAVLLKTIVYHRWLKGV